MLTSPAGRASPDHLSGRPFWPSDAVRWGMIPVQLGERRVLHPGGWRWLRALAWLVLLFFATAAAFGFPLQGAVDLLPPENGALQLVGLFLASAAALGSYALAVRLGEGRIERAGTDLTIYTICSAMRTAARSLEIAELAVRWRDRGVVGFDIAGAEEGFPPTRHLDAFQYVQRENFHTTIHAGEAFGLPSIWEAVQFCGAERLGHGVRIVDDITGPPGEEQLGRLASYIRDRRIPLELCPSSNVQTGAVASIAEHPFNVLARLRFRVTVNTDNRLMSDTTMSQEMLRLVEAFGYGWSDLERFTINAMKSAFIAFDERLTIIDEVIKPRYAVLIG